MPKPNTHSMGHEMHHSEEAEKAERWKEDRALIKKIQTAGGYQKWVNRHEKDTVAHAFPEKPNCLCCMDDRLVAVQEAATYSAGSGILIKDDPKKLEAFAKELKRAGITRITTHAGCGAVGIYAGLKYGYDSGKKGDAKNDALLAKAVKDSEAHAKKLAEMVGGTYDGELPVHPDFHIAQVLYYDMTGKFNPGNAEGVFPPGFVVSRKYMPSGDAVAQVDAGIGIAKGTHGYGKKFGVLKSNKFTIVVVAPDAKTLAAGRKEMRKLHGITVGLDGFVA